MLTELPQAAFNIGTRLVDTNGDRGIERVVACDTAFVALQSFSCTNRLQSLSHAYRIVPIDDAMSFHNLNDGLAFVVGEQLVDERTYNGIEKIVAVEMFCLLLEAVTGGHRLLDKDEARSHPEVRQPTEIELRTLITHRTGNAVSTFTEGDRVRIDSGRFERMQQRFARRHRLTSDVGIVTRLHGTDKHIVGVSLPIAAGVMGESARNEILISATELTLVLDKPQGD